MKSLLVVSCLVALSHVALTKRIERMSWASCATGPTIATITELTLPDNIDAIPVPGSFKVTVKYNTNKELGGDALKVKIKLAKKILGLEVDVPCVANLGSCTYEDVCALLQGFWDANGRCPLSVPIKCTCPIPAIPDGGFTDQLVTIPSDVVSGLISWLAAGDYILKVEGWMGAEDIGCLSANFKISN